MIFLTQVVRVKEIEWRQEWRGGRKMRREDEGERSFERSFLPSFLPPNHLSIYLIKSSGGDRREGGRGGGGGGGGEMERTRGQAERKGGHWGVVASFAELRCSLTLSCLFVNTRPHLIHRRTRRGERGFKCMSNTNTQLFVYFVPFYVTVMLFK